MPGENCCVVGCTVNRGKKFKGTGIFKLPSEKFYKEWRLKWLNEITKHRVVDHEFKRQIENDRVYTCERHFKPEDIEVLEGNPTPRKKPIHGALPTENMPKKSCGGNSVKERTIPERTVIVKEKKAQIKSLIDLENYTKKLKTFQDWIFESNAGELTLKKMKSPWKTPEITLVIDDGMGFTVSFFDWMLPEDHTVYKQHKRMVVNTSLSNLVSELDRYTLCQGRSPSCDSKVIHHCVPCEVNKAENENEELTPYHSKTYYRVKNCYLLIDDSTTCSSCLHHEKYQGYQNSKKLVNINTPAKLKAPISKTNPQKVLLTLRGERLKCAQLEKELEKMRTELERKTFTIDHEMSNDFVSILSTSKEKVTPFMNLFRQQQKKLFYTNPKGMRYHPMIIRFCLSLMAKSKSCYEELRSSNILKLPSSRTLRDYKNFIRPSAGFRKQVIDDLQERTENFFDTQRYVALLFDEMKIKSNLVFDKVSEQLIGFVDLGDTDADFDCLDNETDKLATHTLVFYVRGISTDLKYSLAHFATDGITSDDLIKIFWNAVSYLEKSCNLWVVSVTGDGATSNRRFFKLLCGVENENKVINLESPWRYIYLWSDAPHLMKTARNCLFNNKRHMWNREMNISWAHIKNIYEEDLESGLKLLPKLSQDHINLNAYSKMTVKYAVQVLSKTMSSVLKEFGPPDVYETARFCEILDTFFDCTNVRSCEEGKRKRKPFLNPYASKDDQRFQWLMCDFQNYLLDWKKSVENRPGNFTATERSNMFLSKQTFEGLIMTSKSLVETVSFLLDEGMEYVMTERFCQDPVEEYFGAQRKLGRRSDNPDFLHCLYNDNTLRIQKNVSTSSGNTRGRYDHTKSWEQVTEEPVKKRPKSSDKQNQDLEKINFNL